MLGAVSPPSGPRISFDPTRGCVLVQGWRKPSPGHGFLATAGVLLIAGALVPSGGAVGESGSRCWVLLSEV